MIEEIIDNDIDVVNTLKNKGVITHETITQSKALAMGAPMGSSF